jgi:hypothetical protein
VLVDFDFSPKILHVGQQPGTVRFVGQVADDLSGPSRIFIFIDISIRVPVVFFPAPYHCKDYGAIGPSTGCAVVERRGVRCTMYEMAESGIRTSTHCKQSARSPASKKKRVGY